MIKISRNISSLIFLFLGFWGMLSCSDDVLKDNGWNGTSGKVSYNEDGTLNVDIEATIPDIMDVTSTRALGENPNFDNLSLYMLVFDEKEGLQQFVEISNKQPVEPDPDHTNSGLVKFKAKLIPTENNAVIHLIATDQPNFLQQGNYGGEEAVIPVLYSGVDEDGNPHEAYWQRIDLGSHIPNREQSEPGFDKSESPKYNDSDKESAERIVDLLQHIPLVRNFCKVSVDASQATNFEVTGLYVLNTVDRGSVAPFIPGSQKFIQYYKNDNKYVAKTYNDITKDPLDPYMGYLPSGVSLINTSFNEDSIQTKSLKVAGSDVGGVYFYERPARPNSLKRTYAIVKGDYTDSQDERHPNNYYKVDLGQFLNISDDNAPFDGLFEYYNLLRNFNYVINIKSVAGEGYGSLKDAANGAVYNNFSAAVEARNMSSISDGDDYIYVSRTSYVFTHEDDPKTQDDDLFLYARFISNIDVPDNSEDRRINDNNLIQFYWDPKGSVIDTIVETKNVFKDGEYYNEYRITCKAPTDLLERQELYIYRGNKAGPNETPNYGLYRVVTLFTHKPWPFLHIDTFPGLWESVNDMPEWDWSSDLREVGQSVDSPLTLFFELPEALPQAIFPLDFVIESDRQNIQNAYAGNAVVRSVPAAESLFAKDPTIGTPANPNVPQSPTSSRIQYVKTVTWEDYNGEWVDEYKGTGSRIVRCRFLTITDLAQDGVGGSNTDTDISSTTTLRVYNSYFGHLDEESDTWKDYHQDGFTRDLNTSDPTPLQWDFNSSEWDTWLTNMNSASRSRYDGNSNSTQDKLSFYEATARNMKSGTVEIENENYRFVSTKEDNDYFSYSHNYPASNDRVLRVEVMSTNVSGVSTVPLIRYRTTNENSVTNTYTATQKEEVSPDKTTVPYPTYIYEIDVSNDVKKMEVQIRPASGTPMRFFKINIIPRYDEFQKGTETEP